MFGFIKVIKDYFADTPNEFRSKVLSRDIRDIPSGAILCVRSKSVFGYLIRKCEKGEAWANHIAVYVGSGRNAVIEALSNGLVETKLDDMLNSKTQFRVYVKQDLTVTDLQIIKARLHGAMGKKYGWLEVIRLANPFFKKLITKKSDNTEFCSEAAVRAYAEANIRISQQEPENSTPADVEDYITGTVGRISGWKLFDTFNV